MASKTNNTIINTAKIKCDRCGYQSELEVAKANENKVLINKVDAYSIDLKGQKLEEYSNLKYYICDDCWNDLIKFFDSKEEVEE